MVILVQAQIRLIRQYSSYYLCKSTNIVRRNLFWIMDVSAQCPPPRYIPTKRTLKGNHFHWEHMLLSTTNNIRHEFLSFVTVIVIHTCWNKLIVPFTFTVSIIGSFPIFPMIRKATWLVPINDCQDSVWLIRLKSNAALSAISMIELYAWSVEK